MLEKSATLLREAGRLMAPLNAQLAMQHNGDAELLETQVIDDCLMFVDDKPLDYW